MADRTETPAALWARADREHPDDPDARRSRYLDLMRGAGHIVKREPGDDSPLFPCGYDPRNGRG